MSWIPLHVHSQFSILDSMASITDLVQQACEFNLEALALTDFCNMFGAIDFFKSCKKHQIKPIIGIEIMVAPFSRREKSRLSNHFIGYPLILLAKGYLGYQNLCKISSIGYLEGFYYTPRVDKEILERYSRDLICLSTSMRGYIPQMIIQDREKELEEEITWAQTTFKDDFYFELGRYQMTQESLEKDKIDQESWLYQSYVDRIKNQNKVEKRFLELSKERNIQCIATNEIHYLKKQDWKAHEILMNIQSKEACEIVERDSFGNLKNRFPNPKRKAVPTHELYFKDPEQMKELFVDIPEAIERTLHIAKACNLEIDFTKKYYPVFVPPHLEEKKFEEKTRLKEVEIYLKKLCVDGIKKRYSSERLEKVQAKYPEKDPLEIVKKRLEYEFSVIASKGMCDYLLIVYDFIAWAKKERIPVGPGRGSGAGSIILYLIGITDIEPLQFNLFFERFINPERISYPDIDVDICMDRRSEVIEYTLKKYGRDKVSQIITFGTMKAKMAVRDVGRVLNVSLSKVNEIAKLVPDDLGMTLEKALSLNSEFKRFVEEDEEAGRILEFALKLEGCIRNTGIHAAGIIICGDPLTDHLPICSAKDTEIAVTQYAMKPVEAVGMLKIDFLGLKTLTSIQKTVDAIKVSAGKTIDWVNLPLEDKKTFDLLNEGKTQGIFQLESSGMQELIKQLHIDRFEDIFVIGALYRPGPMEMIPSYVNRKHGREIIEIDHPLMEETIRETQGIIVYQEQVMQIAQELAGYSLGEGDVLRRAMGKKDKEEMKRQREKFLSGALKHGIDSTKAIEIFDKIEKFASYGFNKSHAAAYGYLSYVTAFLKANYPKEWLASLMTCDRDDLSKIAKHIREAEMINIQILPPDVNEAGMEFVAVTQGIRFAMSGIKGVGKGVVEAIVTNRKKKGSFKSLYDFFRKNPTSMVGKKVVENLISAGSFDFTHWTRQELIFSLEPMFELAAQKQREEAQGVLDFLTVLGEENDYFKRPSQIEKTLSQKELLSKEKELLGFYLTGHPMDAYKKMVQRLECLPLHEIKETATHSLCKVAFIVENIKMKIAVKSQRKFAILTISDGLETLELPIWSDLYEEKQELFQENQLLYAVLQVNKEEDQLKLRCRMVEDLTCINEEQAAHLNDLYKQMNKMARKEVKSMKQKHKQILQEKPQKKLFLQLDIDKTRFSQILKLKKLFHQFPGLSPIKLNFHSENQKVALIEIESKWGVTLNDSFKESLSALPFIASFAFE